MLAVAYEYRLKGRFPEAEKVLNNGIEILSLQAGENGSVRAARLKIELARVIIRKTFHENKSDPKALELYQGGKENRREI